MTGYMIEYKMSCVNIWRRVGGVYLHRDSAENTLKILYCPPLRGDLDEYRIAEVPIYEDGLGSTASIPAVSA